MGLLIIPLLQSKTTILKAVLAKRYRVQLLRRASVFTSWLSTVFQDLASRKSCFKFSALVRLVLSTKLRRFYRFSFPAVLNRGCLKGTLAGRQYRRFQAQACFFRYRPN